MEWLNTLHLQIASTPGEVHLMPRYNLQLSKLQNTKTAMKSLREKNGIYTG